MRSDEIKTGDEVTLTGTAVAVNTPFRWVTIKLPSGRTATAEWDDCGDLHSRAVAAEQERDQVNHALENLVDQAQRIHALEDALAAVREAANSIPVNATTTREVAAWNRLFDALAAVEQPEQRLAGFGLDLNREEWGVIIDALIEHRESAQLRKDVNSASTSDLRVGMCADLIARIGSDDGRRFTLAEVEAELTATTESWDQ